MPNKLSYTHSCCIDLCGLLRLWKLEVRIRKENRKKVIVKSNAEQRWRTDKQIWKDWSLIMHFNCFCREEVFLLWFIPKKCQSLLIPRTSNAKPLFVIWMAEELCNFYVVCLRFHPSHIHLSEFELVLGPLLCAILVSSKRNLSRPTFV